MTDPTDAEAIIRARIPYQPITERPKLRLPGGARVAVWTIVNVENWLPEGPMPRTILAPPMGQPLLPDVPNWSWHEYGMRVGFWRFLDVLGSREIKATLALNGSVCAVYEKVCAAALKAGWEFLGHGYVQKPMHRLDDEPAAIADTIAAIRDVTGRPPRGWESPGLSETMATLDHLVEAGIEYVCNWPLDDQPVRMTTPKGGIVAMPYPLEVNDVVISAVQQQPSDALFTRGRDTFDRLYQEGEDVPRVMAISIHPYLTGVPHRIKYLEALYDHILAHEEIVVWTGEEILDWFNSETAEAGTAASAAE